MAAGWPENDGVPLDARAPRALGICDYCGKTLPLSELRYQYEFAGFGLINLHFRVGPECYDKPQEQLRSIILPPDPIPAIDPRPPVYTVPGSAEYLQWVTNLNGFVQNTLNPEAPLQTKSAVLAASVSDGWGLPQPSPLIDRSGTVAIEGAAQQIMPANPNRTYLLVYNPTVFQFGIAQNDQPNYSAPGTVMCGVATALLQNAGAAQPPLMWTGAVYLTGTGAGMPFFAWEF